MSAAATLAAPTAVPRRCQLADVFGQHFRAYTATHPLRPAQRKVAAAIRHCRTEALGGHRQWCERCGFERYLYHSCRNRHCPKCQTVETTAWVQARQSELLPVPYFHHVFTLPHELNPLVLWSERNQRALLALLFDAAGQTLLAFGRQTFGGQTGATLVLHTWDQQLRPHFHIHALVPSGALSFDGMRWIAGGRKFLFPVRGLSKMFRAKYLDGVRQLLESDALDLPPQLVGLDDVAGRGRFLRHCRKKSWVVYAQPPFAGPRKLLDYLGRYTHRVAIANHRLLECDDRQVTFTWRDRADGDRRKVMSLPADEFLRRFLQHVLPDRFQRIRHYGLLGNRGKRERLAHCRELLGARPLPDKTDAPQTTSEWLRQWLNLDPALCPCCSGSLSREVLAPVPGTSPARSPFTGNRDEGAPFIARHSWDTS